VCGGPEQAKDVGRGSYSVTSVQCRLLAPLNKKGKILPKRRLERKIKGLDVASPCE